MSQFYFVQNLIGKMKAKEVPTKWRKKVEDKIKDLKGLVNLRGNDGSM